GRGFIGARLCRPRPAAARRSREADWTSDAPSDANALRLVLLWGGGGIGVRAGRAGNVAKLLVMAGADCKFKPGFVQPSPRPAGTLENSPAIHRWVVARI